MNDRIYIDYFSPVQDLFYHMNIGCHMLVIYMSVLLTSVNSLMQYQTSLTAEQFIAKVAGN